MSYSVIEMMPPNTRSLESADIDETPANTVPPKIEDLILVTFGKSIIDFEATLYEKFHRITTEFILQKQEFLAHLENMEERKLLKSCDFNGVRTWRRLV
jgi:hypothetical protein